jgi:uncharacterized repeat protein (TIGR01451 family)
MPAEAALGSTFEYQLGLEAQDCVANVVVTDVIPAGASYVRSEPAATVDGSRLVWKMDSLDGAQSQVIRVWLKADKEGTLMACATVSADPRVCAETLVGKPMLTIEKSGPATALLNSQVEYTVVVANRGNAVARNVVVKDTVPDGLASADGSRALTMELGDLAPNQAKTNRVSLKAVKRGEFCNVAVATSSNAGEVKDDACTVVQQPGLKVEKTGDKERFLGRNASYQIVVSNTGDTALTDVIVTDTAPADNTIVSATGATITGNKAVWRIANLAAGQQQKFAITLTSKTAGNYCNSVEVATAQGLKETSEACTLWRGLGAVLLEVVDDPDPIMVEETTTYTIRVTNQGTADLINLNIRAVYDAETAPVDSPQGTVSGQNVSFPAVPRLAPKQSFTYTIRVKGVSAGDSRNRITLTADGLVSPVVEEESTRVY